MERQPPAYGFVSYPEELVGWAIAPRIAMTHGKCFGSSEHSPWPWGQLFVTAHCVVRCSFSKLVPFWEPHGLLIFAVANITADGCVRD